MSLAKMHNLFIVLSILCCCGSAFGKLTWQDTLASLAQDGLKDNTTVDTVLGTLRATDAREFVLYASNSSYFNVDSNTGVVRLGQQLDYNKEPSFGVQFTATDADGRIDRNFTVHVLSVSNRAPRFDLSSYSASQFETAPVGRTVYSSIRVTDDDIGLQGQVSVSCVTPANNMEAQLACQKFSVQIAPVGEIAPNSYFVRIMLKETLDFNTKSNYTMYIEAMDGGNPRLSSSATVLISVRSKTDFTPVFLNAPITFFVHDHQSSALVLTTIQATTGENRTLQISIAADPRNYFTIDATTFNSLGFFSANLRSNGQIDYGTVGDRYPFNVKATVYYNGVATDISATTDVNAIVLAPNNNPPAFQYPQYSASVLENIAYQSIVPTLNMLVTDPDSGTAGFLTLSAMCQPGPSDIFDVIPRSGQQTVSASLIVIKNYVLKYPQNYTVTVTARNNATLYGITTVSITVEAANEAPYFNQLAYTTAIRDDREVGRIILTVSASDTDPGVYGELTYSIQDGENRDYVNINARTGQIILARQLNHTGLQVLQYTLVVTDGAGDTDTASLTINVLDSRSTGPKFSQDAYNAFVIELQTDLQPAIEVFASPLQQDRVIAYRLLWTAGGNYSDLFSLHPTTHILTMLKGVDINETPNRSGLYEMKVEAYDNRMPSINNTVPVIISVIDTNNHLPIFTNTTYSRSISESTPPGTTILRVNATDLDIGGNAEISYRIDRGGRDNFKITPDGDIYVSPSSNLRVDSGVAYYNVTVDAVDHGSPPKTGHVTVYIKVVGTDRPRFQSASYVFSVRDSETVNHVCGNVLALVAPEHVEDARIVYDIIADTLNATKSNGTVVTSAVGDLDYTRSFKINDTSGAIRVASRLSFSYAAVYKFVVEATNRNSKFSDAIKTDRADVTIYVLPSDTRDRFGFLPPSDDNTITRHILEELRNGIVVHRVQAYDTENVNAEFTYALMPGSDTNDFLHLNSLNGSITVNKRIDYEAMSPTYEIRLIVKATELPVTANLSVTGTVIFIVDNINDVLPQFSEPAYKYIVYNNATSGQRIGQVNATDLDKPPFNIFTYRFVSGNTADNFNIDPNSGVITTRRPLTDPGTYKLYVQAVEETPNTRGEPSTVPVTIIVVDSQTLDSGIIFNGKPYIFYTDESAEVNSTVGTITAVDYVNSLNLTFGIVPDAYSYLFTINPTTGEIVVNTSLNGYGRMTPYILNVSATTVDSPSRTSYTVVSITLFNTTGSRGEVHILYPSDGANFKVIQYSPTGTITDIKGVLLNWNASTGIQRRFSFQRDGILMDNITFSTDSNGIPLAGGSITFMIRPRTSDAANFVADIAYDDAGFPNNRIEHNFQLTVFATVVSGATSLISPAHVIRVSVVTDYISFTSCDNYTEPLIVHVNETAVKPSKVITLQACNPATKNTTNSPIFYYIIGGNNGTNGNVPFAIRDPQSGVITTNTSFINYIQTFNLTVVARNQSTAVSSNTEGSQMTVTIVINDEDNNGPSFSEHGGIGAQVQRGVRDFPTFGKSIVQMVAGDLDVLPQNRKNEYSIESITFDSKNDYPDQSGEGAFTINKITGDVYPAFASYRKYTFGEFKLKIVARDSSGRQDSSILSIFVVKESDLVGKMYGMRPWVARPHTAEFLRTLETQLKKDTDNVYVAESDLHYHIDESETSCFTRRRFVDRPYINRAYSDLCFHVIKDGEVFDYESNKEVYDDLDISNVTDQCSDNIMCRGLSRCYPHLTTHPWSGHWWAWWWLIALALFIFVVALILAILVCCIFAWNEGRFTENQNYVYLDAPNEFEWQEASQPIN